MKTWGIIIGSILILALVCSPVLAISKSDLISQYKEQFVLVRPTVTSTPTSEFSSLKPTPDRDVSQPLQGVVSLSVSSNPAGAAVYIDGRYRGETPVVIRDVPITCSWYPCCKWITITLTKTGYRNATISELMGNGEHRFISVRLTPSKTPSSENTEVDGYMPWHRPNGYIGF